MNDSIVWIIAVFGLVTLIGVFGKMQNGFGPFNLRAVGIVIVVTFVTLLAVKDGNSVTAAMGILGAVAGYLFGIKDAKSE